MNKNKNKITDIDLIASIAQKQLQDLAAIDGGSENEGKVNFFKLKSFFKKHLRRAENGKVNAHLESGGKTSTTREMNNG